MGQSNAILKYLEGGGAIPPGMSPDEVLGCVVRSGGPGREYVTATDQRTLMKMLGKGIFPDEAIRDVLRFASAYVIMDLHVRRPDLMSAEDVARYARRGAEVLLGERFVRGRQGDKRLDRFVRRAEEIPGLAELVAIYSVHHA